MSRTTLTPVALVLATAAALALAGCSTAPRPTATGGEVSSMQPTAHATRTQGPVALLVPLTGPYGAIGQSIEKAVKLAFSAPGAPRLDVENTGGTAAGAASAAHNAIGKGAGLILGPLTMVEARAVTPVAQSAGVNVLAFTNDDSVARPGIWPLGISPDQQVGRVVSYAIESGRTRTAAILPDNLFGRLMAAALRRTTARLGAPPPHIGYYSASFSSLNATTRSISQFDSRGAGLMSRIRAARDQDSAAGRRLAAKLRSEPVPPPPFDALLLGATSEDLAELQTFLPYYEAGPPQVQLMGPALWSSRARAMATHEVLRGAIYAAPDPSAGLPFDQKFEATYGGVTPPSIDKVAFDAAAISVLAAHEGGYKTSVLTASSGFSGTDGPLRLLPNGHVERGLAVFRIEPDGPKVVSPAPQTLPSPAPSPNA
ncbi:penicillin-binding protein activator [Acidiphilium sp. C61]|uniref:penicillin-binding protein activator n=1 Tax=Acidiphilium sp. C61 TaxID=1671485 RepID=UPI003530371D